MTFTESNSVQRFIRSILANELGWCTVPGKDLPRAIRDVLLLDELKDALVRLNPEIAAQPERADEVIYRLNAILLAVHSDGLVRANAAFAGWLRGEKSMPFGENHRYVPVRLIDFDDPGNNRCIVAEEVTFKPGREERRFDHVLYVNGMPLVVGEDKTPARAAVTWVDADQITTTMKRVSPLSSCPTSSVSPARASSTATAP